VAANPSEKPAARSKEKSETSGTGFFVSTKGHILTNHHVVNECTTFKVTQAGLGNDKVRLVASDEKNDLAVLATDLKPDSVPSLRTAVRMGESISVYGFPLAGLLASTGNFTTGTVTALAGLGDDTRMIQISAPVQPGNSGGPLIDQYGNIVGVIVSKLNALRVAKATDDLPQNINFAIKSVIAQSFLESNDILPSMTPSTAPLDAPQVAERAKAFTVRITCK
jgi:S1-C subfamily serine protease